MANSSCGKKTVIHSFMCRADWLPYSDSRWHGRREQIQEADKCFDRGLSTVPLETPVPREREKAFTLLECSLIDCSPYVILKGPTLTLYVEGPQCGFIWSCSPVSTNCIKRQSYGLMVALSLSCVIQRLSKKLHRLSVNNTDIHN